MTTKLVADFRPFFGRVDDLRPTFLSGKAAKNATMIRQLATKQTIKNAYSRHQRQLPVYSYVASRFFSSKVDVDFVKTLSRISVPTNGRNRRVPLTLVDVQLRDEQLPFAFFFEETLEFDKLASSLENVLKNFPVMGGRIDFGGNDGNDTGRPVAIQCGPEDTVSLSYGISDKPLAYWSSKGHVYYGGGGYPTLHQLFDPLFDSGRSEKDGNNENQYDNLATFRIIHCAGGGTAIGVTFNHALADAASSLRFVQCWGREMRKKQYPKGVSNDRSSATCSGMISPELADILGLGATSSTALSSSDLLPSFVVSRYEGFLKYAGTFFFEPPLPLRPEEVDKKIAADKAIQMASGHEYVVLPFSPELLQAMKECGMATSSATGKQGMAFISTNDMISAFGWMMKRQLSGQTDWNMSMVVNLRGRCGVDAFPDMDSLDDSAFPDIESLDSAFPDIESLDESAKGVFGNAITNVFASMPQSKLWTGVLAIDGEQARSLDDICLAAWAIRASLVAGLVDVPERVSLSRLGKAVQAVPPAGSSFSSTSWGRFPLWNIRFSNERMAGFHGHPSFPLPTGFTFASVISPTKDGGFLFKLLLPSGKAAEARVLHQQVSDDFMKFRSR